MESTVKLDISWEGSTRYLEAHLPIREDVKKLGSLKLTVGEPYSPYSPFDRSNRYFKLDETFLETGRVKLTWTNDKIQEWRQCLGCISAHVVNKTFEASTQ